jgi:type I restriction-modification system DNA methylase subunit
MTGMYYTPKEIEKICDPATGTGAFLKQAADSLSNPPYAFQHRMHWTAKTWRKIINLIGIVVSSLRRQ